MKTRFAATIAALLVAAAGSAQQPTPKIAKAVTLAPRFQLTNPSLAGQLSVDDVKGRNGKGPDYAISLADRVTVAQLDEFSLELRDLCRLSLQVYPDANRATAIFYYRPKRYTLRFDPAEGGYFMTVDYKGGTTEGKNVVIQARLTPGAGTVDREVLKSLLRNYLRSMGSGAEPVLLALPAAPEAHFDLTDWNVEEVTVNGVDPDTGELTITLSADVATKELLTGTLGNINGLVGKVTLRPLVISDEQPMREPIDVSAELRMAEIAGGAPLLWKKPPGATAELVNPWPFPLALRHLCYLTQDPASKALRLRGWRLGEAVLGPGDTARLDVAKLNIELGGTTVVTAFWDATLRRDDALVRKVVESLTGGVGALPVQALAVEVVKAEELFAQYNVYKLAVEFRSAHFDPQGRDVISHTYELDQGTPKADCDPLYLWQDPTGELYEYRVGVITVDGTVHVDPKWRSPNPALPGKVFIGAAAVEEVLAQ